MTKKKSLIAVNSIFLYEFNQLRCRSKFFDLGDLCVRNQCDYHTNLFSHECENKNSFIQIFETSECWTYERSIRSFHFSGKRLDVFSRLFATLFMVLPLQPLANLLSSSSSFSRDLKTRILRDFCFGTLLHKLQEAENYAT